MQINACGWGPINNKKYNTIKNKQENTVMKVTKP